MPVLRLLAIFTLAALFFVPVPADAVSARMKGTVVDPDQKPLAGVSITATSEELASFREVVTTDAEGIFRIVFQQPRFRYTLLFERVGFQSFRQEIQPTATRRMDDTFVMQPVQAQVQEQLGSLTSVVTGSSNEAIVAFNTGLDAQKAGELAAARKSYEKALEVDPTLAPAWSALARVLLDLGEHEAAAERAAKALELRENDVDALRVRYESLRATGKRDEAQALADRLAAADDGVQTARRRYQEGADAFQAEDFETALARFEEAAKLDPNLQDAHHAVATLRLRAGDAQGAADAARTALDLGSEDVRTLRVLYDAYDALGRTEELARIAPRLAAVDPEFGGPKLLEQGAALFNSGETEKAAKLLELALATDPTLAKAHYMLGLYNISADNPAAARRHLEAFLELAPEDPDAAGARDMLGYLE